MPEPAPQRIALLVVDDHAMFRDAIAEKLGKEPDMAVVGSSGSAAEALEVIRAGAHPAVILLDFDLGVGTSDRIPAAGEIGRVQRSRAGGHRGSERAGSGGTDPGRCPWNSAQAQYAGNLVRGDPAGGRRAEYFWSRPTWRPCFRIWIGRVRARNRSSRIGTRRCLACSFRAWRTRRLRRTCRYRRGR